MSFLADKKREHESIAESAIGERNYGKAFLHTAKAAEFGLQIAEQTEGKIAQRYVEDAFELIALAEQMKAKAAKEGTPVAVTAVSAAVAADAAAAVRREVKDSGAAGDNGEDEAGGLPKDGAAIKDRPTMKLDDVAGLDDVKEVLREKVILPFQKPEVFERFRAKSGAGILMYGPPGNGKTYIAKAIAGEVDAAFFPVDLSQVKSKYVGDTAKNLSRIFEEAQQHERAVLFLDEIDALLARRGNRQVDAVAQFLTLTDGINKAKGCVLLLAATNRPWAMDEAVLRPGRIGTHVYVGLPDAKARAAIFKVNMRDVPVAPDVSYEALATQTEDYSGADVAAVCDRAKMAAIRRQLESGKDELISAADFAAVLEKVKASTNKRQIQDFEKWRATGARPAGSDDDSD